MPSTCAPALSVVGNLMASGMHLELHADVGGSPPCCHGVPSGVMVVLDHFAKPAAANADDPTLRAVQRRAGMVMPSTSP